MTKVWSYTLKIFGNVKTLYCEERNGVKEVYLERDGGDEWLGTILEETE